MNLQFIAVATSFSAATLFAAPPVPPKLFPPNRLYVTSFSTDVVKSFQGDGTFDANWTAGGLLDGPESVAFGPDGFLYVSCATANAVIAIDADQAIQHTFDAGGSLSAPNGITFGPFGELVVASRGNDRVYYLDDDDTINLTLGAATTLDSPRHVAFAPDGVLHVASFGTDMVFRFGIGGGWLAPLNPAGLTAPIGVAFSPSGRMLVASSGSDEFAEITKNDSELFFSNHMLENPFGIVVGPDHRVYVAAGASESILRFENGIVHQEIGWFDGISGIGGLAFSPFYFEVRLKGKLLDATDATVKRNGHAMLGYAPGSGRVTLSFTDDLDDADDLASLFEKPVVLHGQEGGSGNQRTFVGCEIPGPDKHYRTTMVNLKINGTENGDGSFVVKSISGSITRTGVDDGSEVYRASLATTKRLN